MKTLNVTQVAAPLFMHPVTVRNMARKRDLPGTRIGRHWVSE